MIRKIKLLVMSAAVAISFTACLEKLPDNGIPANKAIQTLSDAEQAVTGIYASFKNASLYSGLLTLCPDIQSDLVYAIEGYTNIYGDFWRWEVLGSNKNVTSVYSALYSVIGDCNFFFAYIDRVRASLVNDDDFDALEELEGDVYFARALAYSELIKVFCKAYDPKTAENELGVVLVSDYYNPGHMTRANLKKSYEFVLDDLKKAKDYVKRESNKYKSYFTNTVVDALYARVYLYMQDWDNAIKYSTNVIDNEYMRLANVSNFNYSATLSDYAYLWNYDDGFDIIWQVAFTATSRGGALGQVFLGYNYLYYVPDYVPALWALNLYATADLRKETFFKSITTGHTHRLTWPLLIKYNGNRTFIEQSILHVNMPKPFRLSEQYLIRAEAYCQKNDYSKGAADITTLRKARYSSYGSASLSEDNWLDEISNERVRELYMEGFRLQDLKRWGKGFERTPQTNSIAEGSKLKIEAGDPLFVWPIPQHELDSPDADIQPNESNK